MSEGLVNPVRFREASFEAERLVRPVRKEMIALLKELVQTDSVAVPPEGHEGPAQGVLRKHLKRYHLDVETYDTGFLHGRRSRWVRKDRHYEGRPNLICRLPGKGGGRSLLFNGHMDTVPPGRGAWKQGPFSGVVKGGRLYGRGSCDMKGGLAAQFAVAMALKKAKVRLRGDILCESVVDEEWAGAGGTLAARLHGETADACVITEGTGLSVVRATRGGYFFEITAKAGDPEKYFSKEEVVSPAVPLGRLLGWVGGWKEKRKKIPTGEAYAGFPDPAPVQVLAVEANRFDPDVPWAVPLEARIRVYFQFLPHEDVEAVVQEVRESFDAFCREDPFFKAYPPEWKPVVEPPLYGHELPEKHEWTQCLHRSATAALGKEPSLTAAEYPCDAFLIQREFGIPTLLFGPAGGGVHNVDEYVETKSVIQTAEVLLTAALTWCG